MDDRTALIETAVMDRLGHVIDPELGRSVTDLGMIAGVLAARFHRWVIILVTGVSGGWRAASLLGRAVPSMTAQTVLIVAGALAAAGIIFQFVTTRKMAK